MQLTSSQIIESPDAEDKVRLVGEVTYDDRAIGPELYWVEVHRKYGESLSESGNPWLACLLPLAVTLGQPLRISRPVDSLLLENAYELMRVWKCWYPHLHVVPIEAEVVHDKSRKPPARMAAFFSGGIDSFFTVLRHNGTVQPISKVHFDELLYVSGVGIPLDNRDGLLKMHKRLEKAAGDLGAELVDVTTNFRETRSEQETNYSHLSHGSLFGSVALALEKRYSAVWLASSHPANRLAPWGSHPLTDPLLSTNHMKFVHDSTAFTRVEKTEFVAKSDVAMRSLHVCWKSETDQNCGNCNKCYRTMMTLELLGALGRCTTFDQESFDVQRTARLYAPSKCDQNFFQEIQDFALQQGRLDIAKNIDRSFKHTKHLSFWLPIRNWLWQQRVIWQLGRILDRTVIADSVMDSQI